MLHNSSIGSALLSVGHHQGFLATYPEKLIDSAVDVNNQEKLLEDLDYLVLPVKDYSLDIDSISYEDESGRQKSRGSLKVQPSVKAKVAVKKKPVIKWKPYKRPERMDEMPFPHSGDSTPPPGMFEEECAFMWRTIDNDDEDSLNTGVSAVSSDYKNDFNTEAQYFSHYSETRTNIMSDDRFKYIDDPPFETPKAKTSIRQKRRSNLGNRPSYLGGKYTSSWPYMYRPHWSQRKISPKLFRSISETSIFLETLASRLKTAQANQKLSRSSERLSSIRYNNMKTNKRPLSHRLNSVDMVQSSAPNVSCNIAHSVPHSHHLPSSSTLSHPSTSSNSPNISNIPFSYRSNQLSASPPSNDSILASDSNNQFITPNSSMDQLQFNSPSSSSDPYLFKPPDPSRRANVS